MRRVWITICAIGLLVALLAGCGSGADEKSDGKEQDAVVQEQQETVKPDDAQAENSDENKTGEEDTVSSEPEQTGGGETAANPPADSAGDTKPAESTGNQAGSGNSVTDTKPDKTPGRPTTKPPEVPKPDAPKPDTPDKAPDAPSTPPQKTYSISEVHSLVKKAYGADYRADTEIPRDALSSLFGIDLATVEEYIAEQPMISANIDTFIAIKAVSGKGEAVANALTAYKTSLTSQGACLYPSNIPKAQAGQVVRHGDYVFLVMLGAAGDDTLDEAGQLQFAKEQVAKGVNIINQYFAK